jgi:hypothetical protein
MNNSESVEQTVTRMEMLMDLILEAHKVYKAEDHSYTAGTYASGSMKNFGLVHRSKAKIELSPWGQLCGRGKQQNFSRNLWQHCKHTKI